MKPLFVIGVIVLLLPFTARCQDICTLSGNVFGAGRQPVATGDVFILKESDSSILKKANIIKGAFVFEPLIRGEYLLKITAAGFKDKFQLLVLDETKTIVISMEQLSSLQYSSSIFDDDGQPISFSSVVSTAVSASSSR